MHLPCNAALADKSRARTLSAWHFPFLRPRVPQTGLSSGHTQAFSPKHRSPGESQTFCEEAEGGGGQASK